MMKQTLLDERSEVSLDTVSASGTSKPMPSVKMKVDVPSSDDDCIILDETGVPAPTLPALKIERAVADDGARYENACQQLLNLIKLAGREAQNGAAGTSSPTNAIDVDSEDSVDSISIISSECETSDEEDDDDSRSSRASTASAGKSEVRESDSDSDGDELKPPIIINHRRPVAKKEIPASDDVSQLEDISEGELPSTPQPAAAAAVNGEATANGEKTPGTVKLRAWSSKSYCCYCTAGPLRNLERHLTDHHGNAWEVTTLAKETDAEKKAALCRHIRNLGNHRHNVKVLERGRGVLIVGRLSVRNKPFDCYKPCPTCYEYFVKSRRWRHQCYHVKEREKDRPPSPVGTSKRLEKIDRHRKKDELAVAMKLDATLQMYAKDAVKVFKKRASSVTHKLRHAGRLLLLVRRQTGKTRQSVADLMEPQNFAAVAAAVGKLAKLDEETGVYRKPKLARQLYAILSRCAVLRKEKCLKKKEELENKAEQYEQFSRLAAIPDAAHGSC